MLKEKILTWLQKLQEIDAMKSGEEKTQAIDDFFTRDLEDLGLKPGDYVYHDVVRGDLGLRRRDFIYGEENDGSDVVIHVWTGGGQRDKISISSHSLEEYEKKRMRKKALT